MKKGKILTIIIILVSIIVISFLIIFNNKKSKTCKIGNNNSNQEIVDYILNISSYELTAQIEINSNKNKTKYIVNQKYINGNEIIQEIQEPSNIQGVKIIKEGNNVKIENSQLGLSNIYENYEYIAENDLDLECFIQDYKNNNESTCERTDNILKMTTISKKNKYRKYKTLYIDTNIGNPVKLEIEDDNKNTTVYILYTEVRINNS